MSARKRKLPLVWGELGVNCDVVHAGMSMADTMHAKTTMLLQSNVSNSPREFQIDFDPALAQVEICVVSAGAVVEVVPYRRGANRIVIIPLNVRGRKNVHDFGPSLGQLTWGLRCGGNRRGDHHLRGGESGRSVHLRAGC